MADGLRGTAQTEGKEKGDERLKFNPSVPFSPFLRSPLR
jgi:hypothetical protein